MIRSALYRDPQPFDPARHRHKRLQPLTDYSIARHLHAVFLAATEFGGAALSFPIVFVHTGETLADAQPMVSPVALLGVAANENLHVDGSRWDARYVPAFIRRFPFLTAGVPGKDKPTVFVDAAWPGFSDTEGEPLFDDEGKPTTLLRGALKFLREFDAEQQRTRRFCQRLVELRLLRELSLDADLSNGQSLKIEGIQAVDEDRLHALPEADVLQLHRSGMLMLMHVHLASLGNLQPLVERKAMRLAAARG
ncbi:MAG TPA: SapC family protein [Albitalea sp.]